MYKKRNRRKQENSSLLYMRVFVRSNANNQNKWNACLSLSPCERAFIKTALWSHKTALHVFEVTILPIRIAAHGNKYHCCTF